MEAAAGEAGAECAVAEVFHLQLAHRDLQHQDLLPARALAAGDLRRDLHRLDQLSRDLRQADQQVHKQALALVARVNSPASDNGQLAVRESPIVRPRGVQPPDS